MTLKNTLKGIKSIISMKSKSNDLPTSIIHERNFIAGPLSITTVFNDSTVAQKVQYKI